MDECFSSRLFLMETDVSRINKSGVSRLKQCAEDDDGETASAQIRGALMM